MLPKSYYDNGNGKLDKLILGFAAGCLAIAASMGGFVALKVIALSEQVSKLEGEFIVLKETLQQRGNTWQH